MNVINIFCLFNLFVCTNVCNEIVIVMIITYSFQLINTYIFVNVTQMYVCQRMPIKCSINQSQNNAIESSVIIGGPTWNEYSASPNRSSYLMPYYYSKKMKTLVSGSSLGMNFGTSR